MKARKLLNRMFALLMCANILVVGAAATEGETPSPIPTAPAPEVTTGRIEVLKMVDEEPVKDMEVSIYRVADQIAGKLEWTEEYAEYQLTLKPDDDTSFANLPQNLVTVIQRDQKSALATAKTNEEGKVAFPGLEDGVYLVTGQRYTHDGYYYDQIPMLVFLPYLLDDQTTSIDAHMEVKHNATRIPSSGGGDPVPVSRKVLKVWQDDGNEESRPSSVTVQLLNGEKVVDTEVLNEENNWQFTWTNLSRNGNWSVAEVGLAEDYSVSIRREGVTFVVTNTYEEDIEDQKTPEGEKPEESQPPVEESQAPVESAVPETPVPDEDIEDPNVPKEPLPQTGQAWVPVFLCSGFGIASILSGMVMKGKEREQNEA